MVEGVAALAGITVVDLTRVLAGPYCTMTLGDLGAEVIKVERPEFGDDTRHWGPPFSDDGRSAYFLSANRNKRSMTLDLKHEAGKTVLERLIRRADILVDNFRAGTMDELGFTPSRLGDLRPDLIYCTLTGYGYSGPYRDRPGYDFMVQALGGLMSVTGPAEGEPMRTGIAIADLAAGMFAAQAILAALFRRERTGQGERVDISLLDSMVALMSYIASNFLVSGELPQRYGNGHPNIVPYQSFKAADDYFAFAAGNDQQWLRFCAAVDRAEWGEDPRFATNAARVQNRSQVVESLSALFAQQPADYWLELCQDIGLAAAPINSLDEVARDPQVVARGLLERPQASDATVASPLRLHNAPPQVRYPAPQLGEHTDEILAWLGLSAEEIQELRRAQAI